MKRAKPIFTPTHSLVAGIDEAGRGCLAGPVYAAAVILEKGHGIRGLDDSKKLTALERERLFDKIQRRATAFAIARGELEEIARLNILHASMLAMQRAVEALKPAPQHCLVDGNRLPKLAISAEAVIGGDGIHASIMAASILAKVARDREMQRLDAEYPGYGFAKHKGYGTPEHLLALRQLGTCAQHRLTFAPCAQLSLSFAGISEATELHIPVSDAVNPDEAFALDDVALPLPDSLAAS